MDLSTFRMLVKIILLLGILLLGIKAAMFHYQVPGLILIKAEGMHILTNATQGLWEELFMAVV
jgi:hypothetical protein